MFESWVERLSASLRAMAGKSRLTEDNKDTLREVRMALLEADVALSVVEFTDRVKERLLVQRLRRALHPVRSS